MELTIEITMYCPNTCSYCSTNASPYGQHINKQKIFDFLNIYENPSRINISGGEPLSHPNFYEILTYCNKLCDDVRVYTNAIKHIMFNANILTKVDVSANIIILPGEFTYIPDVENIHLLRPVCQGKLKKDYNNKITLSHDYKVCEGCAHALLQANGKIVSSPCKKEY